MHLPASITIHPSQFPDPVTHDLLESLRSRKVNHKFHYDSIKQTQKWLALHEAYSPSRTDAGCSAIYDRSFDFLSSELPPSSLHLIGLGCGGGQKDSRLMQRLVNKMTRVDYTPMDVSTAMVLVAREAALKVIPENRCHPFVCDLATAQDLHTLFDPASSCGDTRIYTFFGMIPNFEPSVILPKLAELVSSGDHLLFSANLAPGEDYDAGILKILPLYDNEPTREWLITFLLDLGVEKGDGSIQWGIEEDPNGSGLKKVSALFRFEHARTVRLHAEIFAFAPGDTMHLFFSYRHTPGLIRKILGEHGFEVRKEWITASEEEGVFYCRRNLV